MLIKKPHLISDMEVSHMGSVHYAITVHKPATWAKLDLECVPGRPTWAPPVCSALCTHHFAVHSAYMKRGD